MAKADSKYMKLASEFYEKRKENFKVLNSIEYLGKISLAHHIQKIEKCYKKLRRRRNEFNLPIPKPSKEEPGFNTY